LAIHDDHGRAGSTTGQQKGRSIGAAVHPARVAAFLAGLVLTVGKGGPKVPLAAIMPPRMRGGDIW
jgi:hypothetical protein